MPKGGRGGHGRGEAFGLDWLEVATHFRVVTPSVADPRWTHGRATCPDRSALGTGPGEPAPRLATVGLRPACSALGQCLDLVPRASDLIELAATTVLSDGDRSSSSAFSYSLIACSSP